MSSVDKEEHEKERKKLRDQSISGQEYMRNFKKMRND